MNPLICTCKPAPDLLCSLCPAHPVSDSACHFPFSIYPSFVIHHSSLCVYSDVTYIRSSLSQPMSYMLCLSLISFFFSFVPSVLHPKFLALTFFSVIFSLAPDCHTLLVVTFLENHFTSHVHVIPSFYLKIKLNSSSLAPQPYHQYRQPHSQSLLSTPLYYRFPHIHQLTTTRQPASCPAATQPSPKPRPPPTRRPTSATFTGAAAGRQHRGSRFVR